MSSTSPIHSLGFGLHAARSRWGMFVALGAALLVLGGIACADIVAATFASVFVLCAVMFVSGVLQVGHAFWIRPRSHALVWALGGLLYAAAGVTAFMDPILTSLVVSAFLGIVLMVAGASRITAGISARPAAGWGWIVGGGIVTCLAGAVVVAAWPAISLVLLGTALAVDLIVQGWTFVAFGLALRSRT